MWQHVQEALKMAREGPGPGAGRRLLSVHTYAQMQDGGGRSRLSEPAPHPEAPQPPRSLAG